MVLLYNFNFEWLCWENNVHVYGVMSLGRVHTLRTIAELKFPFLTKSQLCQKYWREQCRTYFEEGQSRCVSSNKGVTFPRHYLSKLKKKINKKMCSCTPFNTRLLKIMVVYNFFFQNKQVTVAWKTRSLFAPLGFYIFIPLGNTIYLSIHSVTLVA